MLQTKIIVLVEEAFNKIIKEHSLYEQLKIIYQFASDYGDEAHSALLKKVEQHEQDQSSH